MTTTALTPFHLAFPVTNLEQTRRFYGGLLGCPEGRSTEEWIDFDFFGHQLVAHLVAKASEDEPVNDVDGKKVPVRHFGVVLHLDQWHQLAEKLKAHGTQFVIAPYIRFQNEVGEQATMFFLDPCGNALEFKAFKDIGQLFAK